MATPVTRRSAYITVLGLFRPHEVGGALVRAAYIVQAFLVGVILARGLEPAALGQYTLAMSWLQLASGLAILGLPPLIVREISAHLATKEYGHVRGVMHRAQKFVLIASVVATLSAGVAYFVWSGASPTWTTFLIGLPLLIILPLTSIQEAISRGFGFVIWGQLAEFVVRPSVQLGLILALLSGVLPFALSPHTALASFVTAAGAGFVIASLIRRSATSGLTSTACLEFDRQKWFRRLGSFFLISCISIANQQVAFIVLGWTGADSEVAYMRVSTQLALLIPVGVLVMEAINAPELSRLHAVGDVAALQRLAHRSCRLATVLAVPMVFAYLCFGSAVVSALFGPGYEHASVPLFVLTIGQVVNAAAGSVGALTLATRNEFEAIKALGVALVINLLGCLLLAPQWGAIGAAAAVSASVICWNVLMVVQVARLARVVSLPYGTVAAE